MPEKFKKDKQYFKFCLYGFFKNLRFFDAFLILFFLEKGLGFLEIGILYAIREISIIVLEIPSGVIADALGRRKVLIVSFFVYILSFGLFYFSNSFLLFTSAIFLFAAGDALRTGVHKAMIFQYLKLNHWQNQKVAYYGNTRSWSQFGTAISALIAASVVFYSGNYRSVFAISAIPYLIGMVLIASYPSELEGEKKVFSLNHISTRFKTILLAMIETVKKNTYLRSITNLSIFTGYYRSLKDYIQPLIKNMALSIPFFTYLTEDKKAAVLVGIIYFFTYFLTGIASRQSIKLQKALSGPIKSMNLTILIGFTIGIATGLFFLKFVYVLSILGFLAIILIENLRKPIGISILANLTKDEAMATSLSTESQLKSVFTAIIAPILGWIADSYNPAVAIAIISFTLLLTLPFYWLKK